MYILFMYNIGKYLQFFLKTDFKNWNNLISMHIQSKAINSFDDLHIWLWN